MDNRGSRFLLFSIDTEPDDPQWRGLGRTAPSFRNFAGVPALLDLCRKYGVRPTFLLTYSAAGRQELVSLVRPLAQSGAAEVGTHFHPGDTHPLTSDDPGFFDNILNLPAPLLAEKFAALHTRITEAFGPPLSYRAGSWAFDPRMVALLSADGYRVDSSVTPHVSWRLKGRPSYLSSPVNAYRLPQGNGGIIEIPVSIWAPRRRYGLVGEIAGALLSPPLNSRQGLAAAVVRKCRPWKPLWLRPAFASVEEMKKAAAALEDECDFLHVMCHSNELTEGTSPYTADKRSAEAFYERLEAIFEYARRRGYVPETLAGYARIVDKSGTIVPPAKDAGIAPHDGKTAGGGRTSGAGAILKRVARPMKWLLAVLFVVIVAANIDVAELHKIIMLRSAPLLLAAIVCFSAAAQVLNALKVRFLLRPYGLTMGRLTLINLISSFFAAISPAGIGQEIARVYLIGKRAGSITAAAFAVIIDRISGLWFQLFFTAASFCFITAGSLRTPAWLGASAAGLLVTVAAGWLLIVFIFTILRKAGATLCARFPNAIITAADIHEYLARLKGARADFLAMLAFGLCYQALIIAMAMVFSDCSGVSINFFQATLLMFLGTVVRALPVSVNGLGVVEAVYMLVYQQVLGNKEAGLVVALALRLAALLPALAGWLLFMREGTGFKKFKASLGNV